MDETFFSVLHQFFLNFKRFMEKINSRAYPFVFALLPGKSETIYQQFFHPLMNYCAEICIMFHPQVVMCDFEIAVKNILQRMFPNASVKGCVYYFTHM